MTDSQDSTGDISTVSDLRRLRYVGPATADILRDADIAADDIKSKNVSYRELVEEGINPGVAAKIRREHSLPWTISGMGSDLDQRSETVSGLSEAEKRWVSLSNADWETTEVSTEIELKRPEIPKDALGFELIDEPPELRPVDDLDAVDKAISDELAKAGVNTVRRLATVDPKRLADALEISEEILQELHDQAVENA